MVKKTINQIEFHSHYSINYDEVLQVPKVHQNNIISLFTQSSNLNICNLNIKIVHEDTRPVTCLMRKYMKKKITPQNYHKYMIWYYAFDIQYKYRR